MIDVQEGATTGDAAAEAAAAAAAATQKEDQTGATGDGSPAGTGDFDYATLSNDEATRTWLEKHELKTPEALATKAYNLDKVVGGAVKVPGKDATPEEVNDFYSKLGRPDEAGKYEFAVPQDLPESVPYNADMAGSFKEFAHSIGLSQDQAGKAHDWFVGQQVEAAGSVATQNTEKLEELAATERTKLEQVWGAIGSEGGKRNAEMADRAMQAGPPELLADFMNAGMLGPNKEVLNANLGILLSTLGAAVYQEDGVLKGDPAAVGNPFDEKSDNYSMTEQMAVYKNDPNRALQLIAAAGKKPEDFGLKP